MAVDNNYADDWIERSRKREREKKLKINQEDDVEEDDVEEDRKLFWKRICITVCANYGPDLVVKTADSLLEAYDNRFVNPPEPSKNEGRKLDL